jgi:hypothetical protein
MSASETVMPRVEPLASPSLATLAFVRLAVSGHLLGTTSDANAAPEAQWLRERRSGIPAAALDPARGWAWWSHLPPQSDLPLHRIATELRLSMIETFALALAIAADSDPAAARTLSWLQAPRRDSHPTFGLLARLGDAYSANGVDAFTSLLDGTALASGLLTLDRDGSALPDSGLRVPLPLLTALLGGRGHWLDVELDQSIEAPGTEAMHAQAGIHARTFELEHGLLVRSADARTARAACRSIGRYLGRQIALVSGDVPRGLGPWLILHDAIPVLVAQLAPGERKTVPPIPGYNGGVLIATGIDGGWERDGASLPGWDVPMPTVAERTRLWRDQGLEDASAQTLARTYRLGAEGTERLAQDAQTLRIANGGETLSSEIVATAARRSGRGLLGTLAEPLTEDIEDGALILPETLRADLRGMLARCRVRDGLADDLGAAARARYRPGVRGLFVGPSGTGKTLACGWLATRLGLPLYRVDMAAVTSKYIGETEKHLGELFARAESCNVVLMFDEADSLFGKRTDVKDAHDRYANQQTNYLLQRIESYDGIVLLTSNSRSRFDTAFTRRLDAILEFPLPQPEERRALWLAHLGEAHAIAPVDLNRLAAGCELAGGHIRNVVLAARALSPDAPISWFALTAALTGEYRKLGKPIPSLLNTPRGG